MILLQNQGFQLVKGVMKETQFVWFNETHKEKNATFALYKRDEDGHYMSFADFEEEQAARDAFYLFSGELKKLDCIANFLDTAIEATIIANRYEDHNNGFPYQDYLKEHLANQIFCFNNMNFGRQWDGEFPQEIDSFITKWYKESIKDFEIEFSYPVDKVRLLHAAYKLAKSYPNEVQEMADVNEFNQLCHKVSPYGVDIDAALAHHFDTQTAQKEETKVYRVLVTSTVLYSQTLNIEARNEEEAIELGRKKDITINSDISFDSQTTEAEIDDK